MEPKIDLTLTKIELNQYQFLSNYGEYNLYTIEMYGCDFIIAVNNSNHICACFEFVETEEGFQLAHMNVSEEHKHKGLGKEIMRQAVKLLTYFELPSFDKGGNNYYLTEDGLPFIISCFEKDILSENKFKHPLNSH